MRIYVGADHRGFVLKGKIAAALRESGYDVEDEGAPAFDPADDYPVFAKRVAARVAEAPQSRRGIVICGSGIGVDVTANKVRGIRSALVFREDQARMARADDDTNVLALAADYLTEDEALKIVRAWIDTPFGGEERHQRRIKQITELEEGVGNKG